MCKLMDDLREKSEARGEAQGKLNSINSILSKGMTLEAALGLLYLDQKTYEKYETLAAD